MILSAYGKTRKVKKWRPVIIAVALCLLFPHAGRADVFNGFLELDYGRLTSRSSDATGRESRSQADSLVQRYSLLMNKSFFPQLNLRAGYLFESNQSWQTSQDQDTHASITTSLPSFDLTMGNPFLNGAVGYNRRKESENVTGSPSLKRYNEDYHATLGWRPEGLPSVSLLMTRINTFDETRTVADTTNDRLTLGSTWLPIKNLDLRYLFGYETQNNRLQALDVTQMSQTGRVGYSGKGFADRVAYYSSYNISRQSTTTAGGSGLVQFQVTPFAGLFSVTQAPAVGALEPSPALIDANLTTSAGINIGPLPPPQTARNMGLDLLNQVAVNRLLIWVSPGTTGSTSPIVPRLPDRIARLYSWDIYTSADNLTWNRVNAAPITNLTLDPFQNRFEINFAALGLPAVTTRYLKVVVTPLEQSQVPPGLPGFPAGFDLFVTELQAFQERPAETVRGETTSTSQIFNLGVKVRLLETPSVTYDGSFFSSSSSPGGFTRYTIANGLLADYRFNDMVTAGGRAAREDSFEPVGHRESYVYNATLRLTPLQAITNTVAYSGRTEFLKGEKSTANSLFLNNTLAIYQGVDLNASGGVTLATAQTGEKTSAYSLLMGLSVVPRKDLSFTINYNLSDSTFTGGIDGERRSFVRRGDAGVSYRPFSTLYLLASVAVLQQTGKKADIFQNYGLNWSPFPEGNLQFNFAFAENLRTLNQEKSRLISPSLTWKITRRTILDLSYPIQKTESRAGNSTTQTLSAVLKMSF